MSVEQYSQEEEEERSMNGPEVPRKWETEKI
jgi:hypothetical protein